ncbi:hypothetical protein CCACVL1_03603 [Corchorus capsularis]|uniref:Uncharacterized protein n=1 Tax=Corchorus capsularis TaxID=210143 RepID=A0A1R3JYC1_COCAP|nr:hypothetical protein CCACVL1_03603 [Corchorus capsularis]
MARNKRKFGEISRIRGNRDHQNGRKNQGPKQ